MKTLILQLSLCVLCYNGLRLGQLVQGEWKNYGSSQSIATLSPNNSSLVGVTADGRVVRPEIDDKKHLKGQEHMVLFPLISSRLSEQVSYWNDVIEHLKQSGGGYHYWGVCDAGGQCAAAGDTATFENLSYLSPYQMRIVSQAAANQEVLLYGPNTSLLARVPVASDPETMARALRGQTK